MASPEQVTMYRCYECGALLKSYFSAECCAQLDKRKREVTAAVAQAIFDEQHYSYEKPEKGFLAAQHPDDIERAMRQAKAAIAAIQPTLPAPQGEVERCALCSCQLSRPWTGSDEPHCGECLSALAPDQNVVAYLRRRATQRPSDGLVERQGLPEIAIEYGQALLNACADEIEARAQQGGE